MTAYKAAPTSGFPTKRASPGSASRNTPVQISNNGRDRLTSSRSPRSIRSQTVSGSWKSSGELTTRH